MKSLNQVFADLRNQNIKQYLLFSGSCLFSVLFITLYISLITSKTVLDVLPEGGDSRQQMMIIFVLAVLGCAIFTIYTLSLFFRYKSREVGILLVLGATTKQVKKQIRTELSFCTVISSFFGAVLAVPLAWGIWQLFQLILVDTKEMSLVFEMRTYLFSSVFIIFVITSFLIMINRYVKSDDIIDIINKSRKMEIVKDVPKKCTLIGVFHLIVGLFVGYSLSGFIVDTFQFFPPDWVSLVGYIPAIFGLYLLLLERIAGGVRKGKKRYKNIISDNMMKFQGRQTVRNMLIITLLVAGAYFASFYVPTMVSAVLIDFETSKSDYVFNYRADQNMVAQADIENLAEEMNVVITDYSEQPTATLGVDGYIEVEQETDLGTSFTVEYSELSRSEDFLSESAYNLLTGENVDVKQGEVVAIYDNDGNNRGRFTKDIQTVTNPITRAVLKVTPNEDVFKNSDLFGYYILDDKDYEAITTGLPSRWAEIKVLFNVQNVDESYEFAQTLLEVIADNSSEDVAIDNFYDPVIKMLTEEQGKTYFLDSEDNKIDLTETGSSSFRTNWKYMPSFAVMEQNDFVKTYAVYLVLFLLIAIICFVAVIVIVSIRSYTIALTNKGVYSDLRQLGATNSFLFHSLRGQIRKIFFLPILIGTVVILGYYTMILFMNSGGFEVYELFGLLINFGVTLIMSVVFYIVYRIALLKACHILEVAKN